MASDYSLVSADVRKSCNRCRCWACWLTYGFAAELCHACPEAVCPSARASISCAERLANALKDGRVAEAELVGN